MEESCWSILGLLIRHLKKTQKNTLPFNDSNLLNVSSRSSPFEEVSGGKATSTKLLELKPHKTWLGLGPVWS